MDIRNLPLDIMLKMRGTDVCAELKKMQSQMFLDREDNYKIAREKLRRLIRYSVKYVPYYRKVIDPQLIKAIEDDTYKSISEFPTLTKSLIRDNFEDLKTTDLSILQKNQYYNTSGGSTGHPVKLLQDRHYWTTGMAGKWMFFSFCSSFPCQHIKFWGNETEVLKGSAGYVGRIKNALYRRRLINSFSVSMADFDRYVSVIKRNNPRIIEGYVNVIYELSRYLLERRVSFNSVQGVFVTAGTLYPHMREVIEKAFGVAVYNRYGSREVGDIACNCDMTNELHVDNFSNYVEVLDNNMNPCQPGQMGRIFVTNLNNYSMPLIRYEIGDIGAISSSKDCACGRTLPLLAKVEGREMSVFRKKDGGFVPAEFFIHFIGVVFNKGGVGRFQVIQKDYDLLQIKVVVEDYGLFNSLKKNVEESIRKVVGRDCRIVWKEVESIDSLKSGKYVYVLSEINHE